MTYIVSSGALNSTHSLTHGTKMSSHSNAETKFSKTAGMNARIGQKVEGQGHNSSQNRSPKRRLFENLPDYI